MSRVLAGVLLLSACQLDSAGNGQQTQNQLAAQLQAVSQRMHERYGGAHRLLAAIARSDLERVHAEAHTIAQLDEPTVLPEWRPYFEAIAETARQIEAAPDVAVAGRTLGMLGARCAACHEAAHAKPNLPPIARGEGSRMLEHQQAAIAMWDGVMAPSDDHWLAGAELLTTVPLAMVAQAATPSWPDEMDDVARIRMHATTALRVGDRTERTELFGTILATCSHCHAALRDR